MPARLWALLALGFGVAMGQLDSSIANVALPAMRVQLGITPVEAIWIVNAYQAALVAGMLTCSALGETLGYRRIYLSGAALFTVASLGCALAPSFPVLVAARVVQGAGAAGIISVANALLRYIFPRHMLGRGFGYYSLLASSATAAAPSVAAAILFLGSWPWLFAINVPIGILVVAAGARVLPASDRAVRRFDLPGALLTAGSLALLVLGVDGLAQHATPVLIGGALLGAAALGLWLTRLELRLATPLLPLDLLRLPAFSISAIMSVVMYSTYLLAFVALPFYFRDQLGLSQATTGLLLTPWPVILGVMGPFAGWLADRYSPGLLAAMGLLVTAIGMLLLATLPEAPGVLDIVWRICVCGIGWGLAVAPNSRAMMSAAPLARTGAASGMTAATRLFGQTMGTAAAAVMFGVVPAHATQFCLLLGAVMALLAAMLGLGRHRAHAVAPAAE